MNVEETTRLPDLASRLLGGSVVSATDELFGARENLILPSSPTFVAGEFGPKGQVYDGWETRRRRDLPEHPTGGDVRPDSAVVRLGIPGVVRGVVVDTSWFTGNYPPEISVEAAGLEGYPGPGELDAGDWHALVERSPVAGDTVSTFDVSDTRRFTHVRLCLYPDGGVARLRVHGEPVPDPRLLAGTVDLAAVDSGADVVECSDMFYSSARHLLLPGVARSMAEGWETARRRDRGNDYVVVRLAGRGQPRVVEVDTACFVGNAPGWAAVRGIDATTESLDDGAAWFDLLPRTALQPDTRHRWRTPVDRPVTHVRLDIYPDGGVARLRVHGELLPDARAALTVRWLELMPDEQVAAVLGGLPGGDAEAVQELLARRPFSSLDALPEQMRVALLA